MIGPSWLIWPESINDLQLYLFLYTQVLSRIKFKWCLVRVNSAPIIIHITIFVVEVILFVLIFSTTLNLYNWWTNIVMHYMTTLNLNTLPIQTYTTNFKISITTIINRFKLEKNLGLPAYVLSYLYIHVYIFCTVIYNEMNSKKITT